MAATADGRLVHELIVKRLFEVSDDYVADAAQQSEPLKPGEQFKHVQSGIVMLAKHAPQFAVDSLEEWRKRKVEELQERGLVLTSSKRGLAAMEGIVFITMMMLLDVTVNINLDSATLVRERALDIILRADRFVSDLTDHREFLIQTCKDAIGAISRIQLLPLAESFQKKIKERLHGDGTSREQIYQLCKGMYRVRLPMDSAANVSSAVAAMRCFNPLQPVWKDVHKKSRVQHCLCQMLCSILQPLVNDGLPMSSGIPRQHPALREWYDMVQIMLDELLVWVGKKNKHFQAGYPLAARLVCICIQQPDYELANFYTFIEKLHKLMRDTIFSDAANRLIGLECLAQCARSFAQSHSTAQGFEHRLVKLLEPVIVSIRKGNIASHPKQLAVVHQLCLECMSHAPQYITQLLVLLIKHDAWECALEGVRATFAIMTRSAARLSQIYVFDEDHGNTSEILAEEDSMPRDARSSMQGSVATSVHGGTIELPFDTTDGCLDRALDVIRRGSHPLELYTTPGLYLEFLEPVGYLLQNCWKLHGERLLGKPTAGSDGQNVRTFALSMKVFEDTIRLAPICEPSSWLDKSGYKMAEKLALLTVHASKSIRDVARKAQRHFIQGRPKYRNAIIVAMCLLVNRVQWSERQHEDISASLLQLIQHWRTVLIRDAELQEAERSAGTASGAKGLDVATVEGCGLLMLCSASTIIRQIGWQLLQEVRILAMAEAQHRDHGSQISIFAATVLEQTGADIVHQHAWGYGTFAHLMRQFKEVPSDLSLLDCLSASDNRRCGAVLPHLLSHLQVMCPQTAQSSYEQVSMHMMSMTKQEGPAPNRASYAIPTDSIAFEQWQLYTTFLMASEPYPNARRPANVRSADELLTHLLSVLRGGIEVHMQAATAALGACHQANLQVVLQHLLDIYPDTLGEGHKKTPKLIKREELRTSIAQIFCNSASLLAADSLHHRPALAAHYVRFLSLTLQQIANAPQSTDVIELKCFICTVTHVIAQQDKAVAAMLTPEMRGRLWAAVQQWMGARTDLRGDESRLMRLSTALPSVRGSSSDVRSTQPYIRKNLEAMRLTGFQAMASLLSGPLWDDDMRKQGTALAWFDAALSSLQPQRSELLGSVPAPCQLAQFALRDMLIHNPDLRGAYLERCYSREPKLAKAYFHTCAGICVQMHVDGRLLSVWKSHELISLVLHKIVNSSEAVRNDALQVLQALMDGVLVKDQKRQATSSIAVVIGQLQDSQHQFQLDLSSKLATQYAELAPSLTREVLSRQLRLEDHMLRQYVLRCLSPWLEHMSLARKWEGTKAGEVLWLAYQMTQKHGQHCPNEVQQLWNTIASKADNVAVVVDFVIQRSTEELGVESNCRLMDSLDVSKRILLFCSNQNPQLVVDELMSECAQLINEEEVCPTGPQRKLSSISTFHAQFGRTEGASVCDSAGKSRALDMSQLMSNTAQSDLNKMWDTFSTGSQFHSFPQSESVITSGVFVTGAASAVSGSRSYAVSAEHSSFKSGVLPTPVHERKLTRDTSFCSDELNGGGIRAPNRAELALCMLAELSHHHADAFRGHLPGLLLVCIIEMDSAYELVFKHAHQVLVNLVYAMAVRNLEAHAESGLTEKYQAVAAVVQEIQTAALSPPLWPAEMITFEEPQGHTFPALQRLVTQIVDCMFFETDLKARWTEEALNWAMHVPSLAVAQRCMHVARALGPQISPSLVHVLLSALMQCYLHPSVTSFDFTSQLLLALLELLRHSQASEVNMYPQLFWGCLALLQTVHVPVFALVLVVLDALLCRLQLWNLPCQQIMQAGACMPHVDTVLPSGVLDLKPWVLGCHLFDLPRLSFVQQLLWKGLLHERTCMVTVQVLTSILWQLEACLSPHRSSSGVTTFQAGIKDVAAGAGLASPAAEGMGRIMGQCSYQLVACLVSGLPWVLAHRHESESRNQVVSFCNAAAGACMAYGATEVAPRITAIAAGPPENISKGSAGLQNLLTNFAGPFVTSFLPEHASLVFVFCARMLIIGPDRYQHAYLMLLACIYRSPQLNLGGFGESAEHISVLRTLVLLIESSRNAEALSVLDIVLSHLNANKDSGTRGRRDMDATKLPAEFLPVPGECNSCKAVVDALKQCVATLKIPNTSLSGWSNRSRFLPFLRQD